MAAHELAKLALLCNHWDEPILSSVTENVHVIVANDLLAIE